MLPRSFRQEHCVPAIQRISDNSLNLASQQDQEYSIGCDSCHCDLRRCFAMYICLGVTSMMYYIKTLRDLQRERCPYFLTANAVPVGTPVFEKVWVLATIAVFQLQSPISASRLAGGHHERDDGQDEQCLQGQQPCRKASAFQKATSNVSGPGSPGEFPGASTCINGESSQNEDSWPPRLEMEVYILQYSGVRCYVFSCFSHWARRFQRHGVKVSSLLLDFVQNTY